MRAWRSSATQDKVRRAHRAWAAVAWVAVGAMTLGALTGPAEQNADAAPRAHKGKTWQPRPVVTQPAVTPQPGKVRKLAVPQKMPGFVPGATTWPSATTVDTVLGTSNSAGNLVETDRAATDGLTALAGTPVSIGPATAGMARAGSTSSTATTPTAPAKVAVTVASHAASQAAGASAMVLSVARADGGAASTKATVAVDYSSFMDAFGGNFADRMTLIALPPCSLTTPTVPSCRKQSPVAFTNDRVGHKLTATITVPGVPAAPAGNTALNAAPTMVLAATSSTTGMNGSYSATPLKPSDTWTEGGNSGSFTYTYPITVPPALGGSAPSVGLSYDSGDVDGRTSVSNAQGSWVGDGWDYNPGSITRTFQPCTQTGYTGDECWGTPGITLQMPGLSGALVKDDASGTWRVQGDSGARVQLLTGAANGDSGDQDQYWLITTTDGTQYYFGAVQLPGGTGKDTPTYSAWGVPVFGTGSPNSACTDPSTAMASNCRAAWQWNLDFVVDPNQNLTRYTYAREENYYLRGPNSAPTEYQRGGFLSEIDYGWQVSDAAGGAVHPATTVVFTPADRCISDRGQAGYASTCPTGPVTISSGRASTGLNAADHSAYVDTPFDQACTSAGTTTGNVGDAACTDYTPSFFISERLSQITTNVWTGTAYRTVDQYSLPQQFNTVPDPSTAGNAPTLWLAGIQHTGYLVNADGSTTATPEPEVYTHGGYLPNRANTVTAPARTRCRRTTGCAWTQSPPLQARRSMSPMP